MPLGAVLWDHGLGEWVEDESWAAGDWDTSGGPAPLSLSSDCAESDGGLKPFVHFTLHCLIEDTCLLFSRTAFLLDAFYCTLDDYLKDQCVYYCTLDFD